MPRPNILSHVPHPTPPPNRVLVHGDGHRNWKNSKSVIVTSRLMDARRGAGADARYVQLSHNSPLEEHIYAAWPGGETNAYQKSGCKRIAEMMEKVCDEGLRIECDGTRASITVEFVVGGDYPWIAACMGLVGHISAHPCVWCEVEKSKLGAWRPQVLDRAGFVVLRNAKRHKALAHLGGFCPTCKKTYVSTSTTAAARDWAALSKSKQREFSRDHMGTYHLEG
jgi:hypothetical protein